MDANPRYDVESAEEGVCHCDDGAIESHPACRRPRRRATLARAAKRRAGARAARCLHRFFPAGGAAVGAGTRLAVASLTDALPFAIRCRDRADSGLARFLGRVAVECLVSMGMHRARRRAGWRAVARPYARLAVSRSWAP